MSWRLTAAHALVSCALVLPGCFLDHGRGDPGPAEVDAAVASDASRPTFTADSTVDAGLDAPFVEAPMCMPGGLAVEVFVEPVTTDVARCGGAHFEGVLVYGLEAAPERDGIRVRADFCPGADADCRCDVVIANVGTDVEPSELLDVPLTLDLRAGSGPGTFVAFEQRPRCRCDGCACSLELVLYAADATPEAAPSLPRELSFVRGNEVCPDVGCTSGRWSVAVAYGALALDVPEGTERTDGAIHTRGLRDVEVFAPCAACVGCGVPHASWVAWAGN